MVCSLLLAVVIYYYYYWFDDISFFRKSPICLFVAFSWPSLVFSLLASLLLSSHSTLTPLRFGFDRFIIITHTNEHHVTPSESAMLLSTVSVAYNNYLSHCINNNNNKKKKSDSNSSDKQSNFSDPARTIPVFVPVGERWRVCVFSLLL